MYLWSWPAVCLILQNEQDRVDGLKRCDRKRRPSRALFVRNRVLGLRVSAPRQLPGEMYTAL